MTESLRVAILGAGKIGCSIHRGLVAAGHAPVLLWTRSAATAAAAGVPATSGALPDIDADLVLLAVEDSAVASLAAELLRDNRLPKDVVVAHTAGALDLAPLSSLSASCSTGSFHPIVSVASRTTPLSGSFAGIAGTDARSDARLTELAALLGMRVVRPQGDRARYHAAAAIAGNFPQVLLEAATRLLLECGLTAAETREAFGPLLLSAARNAAESGPAAGLTGPIVRGDLATVERHLKAIEAAAAVERLYVAASAIAVDLAGQRGAPNLDALRDRLKP